MNKKAIIYWFSGTGNTEKVAREYKKNFEENKIETLLYKVGDNFENMPNPQNYDYVGIAYPIHGFNAPYPIFDIIKLFPKTKNKNIFYAIVSRVNSSIMCIANSCYRRRRNFFIICTNLYSNRTVSIYCK